MEATRPIETVSHGPQMNALQHGLRSAAVLLPGDDLAEFKARRREHFEEFNPATRSEADCVENIVAHKWRIERCQRLEARFRAALNAVAGVEPPGDHICEPDPHRWQHRGMDCTLEEQRLTRLLVRELHTLFLLQRMRRNRLIDGALHTTKTFRDFLGDEEALRAPPEPAVAAAPVTSDVAATPSTDEPIANSREREAPAPATPVLRAGKVAAWLARERREPPANPPPSAAAGRSTTRTQVRNG